MTKCRHPSANQNPAQAYEMSANWGGGDVTNESGCALVAVHSPHQQMPQTSHHHHHDPRKRKANHFPTATVSSYEVTADEGASNSCAQPDPVLAAHVYQLPHNQEHRKRKVLPQFVTDTYDLPSCEAALAVPQPPPPPVPIGSTRKRKPSSFGTGSTYDDDGSDDTRISSRTAPDKKQNHSEIEKRRRDKMNTFISELSAMIPMCGAMARKLDKLTVLRMAVQHLRSVRGALSSCPLTTRPCPAYLSEKELNGLILEAAHDCFLLVVGCDRGRLLYVSASVKNILHYDQSELLGQSLFDILHPKDVAKVKEQLSSSDLSPRERLIDAKTMLPVKPDVVAGASRLCPGAKRSFFCRIKCKLSAEQADSAHQSSVKKETETNTKMKKKQSHEKKYCVVQCTGYLKSWAPAEMSEGPGPEGGEESEACNLSCLVAVGRALGDLAPCSETVATDPPTRHLQYVSRHATDGKFLFVDQRVTLALGFLPQELLGTSLYEYVNWPELGAVARTHKAALFQRETLHTPPYLFRKKDGTMARIQTHFKPFKNPWTKEVECLVANNTVVSSSVTASQSDFDGSYEMFKQNGGKMSPAAAAWEHSSGQVTNSLSHADVEMQRLIDSQVESHKIGSAISEEALRRSSSDNSPELPPDLLQDVVFNQQFSPLQLSLVDNILSADMSSPSQVRNNVTLSAAGSASPPPSDPAPENTMLCGTPPPASPPLPPLGLDGNGEAAMAVIMSLLEADAGLGGPVNFSGLPWPLP